MHNCPLLDVCKKEPIQISWKGSEECFIKNRKNLDLAFGGGSLSWKRDGQKGAYPLHVRYKPKFVTFGDKVINKDQPGNYGSAFLHFFFVYPSSAEDYRYNIRPIASDWFAKVNEVQNIQWIIIFDSSKAKEKKIRNAIWERLRSDFAKYVNRLIEISDTSNATEKNAFFSVIQSTLMTSFNVFVNNLQSAIQRLKSTEDNESYFLPKIVNLGCNICLFYWNLGLIENALHELDDVDRFLTSVLTKSGDQNKWVKCARHSPFGSSCLYLGKLMRKNVVDESTASLAELRAFVLAHQILLTFHMFYQRYVVMVGSSGSSMSLLFGENLVESSEVLTSDPDPDEHGHTKVNGNGNGSTDKELIESTDELTFQLCQNFVSFIWRYTHDALKRLMEDLAITKANYSPTMLHISILVWYTEISICCDALGDVLRMESASYFICQMAFLQCDSLLSLLPLLSEPAAHSDDLAVVHRWFEISSEYEKCEPSASAFAYLNWALFGLKKEDDSTTKSEPFAIIVRKKLLYYAEIFRNFNYFRHLETINSICFIMLNLRNSEPRIAFESTLENYRLSLVGRKALHPASYWARRMIENFTEPMSEHPKIIFNCYFILAMENDEFLLKFVEIVRCSTGKHFKSNMHWTLPQKFPWRVVAVSNSFIQCDLHKKIKFKMKIESEFLHNKIEATHWLENVKVKVGLRSIKSLTYEGLHFSQPMFNCVSISAADEKRVERFFCLSTGNLFSPNHRDQSNGDHIGDISEEQLSTKLSAAQVWYLTATSQTRVSNQVAELEFACKANQSGCFALDHVIIDFCENCVFHLDYATEICQNQAIGAVLCFVKTKKPRVSIITPEESQGYLLAGVAQKLCVELNTGTLPTDVPTELKISFVGAKPLMQFLSQDGHSWERRAQFIVPHMRSEETSQLEVVFCLDIDRMNFSADQSLVLRYDLKVDWLNRTWYFPLNFLPIINLKSMTSQLGDRVLFEVDLQRCDSIEMLKILPEEAVLLQDQSVAKSPVEAALLNPIPFQPIVANSSYRFVWRLPTLKISKSIPITHFIKLSYTVKFDSQDDKKSDTDLPSMPSKNIVERKYLFENKLTFAVQKVEYEVSAHVLSEKPQSVLCRVDVPCDLIVSLRSLSSGVPESIIVVVEVDPQFWTTIDKFKVVHIKGSGIGQTLFSIIPKRVGYLPYPDIFVHRHVNGNQNANYSFNETTFIGERMNSFHRNQGKQIHVLAQLQDSEDTSSMSSVNTLNSTSTKKSLKNQAKDKIQKLFELKD